MRIPDAIAPQVFAGTDTREVVLRAAMTRFASYGYRRTSMEDIASEAEVSRPTLYAYFKNKQAILQTVSEGIHGYTLENIQAALALDAPLRERLERAFWAWVQPFMQIFFGSPHGAELIGAGSAMASSVSADARQQFQGRLAKTLETARKQGELSFDATGLSAARAAEFLILSLNGLSTGEANERTSKQRLKLLVTLFLSATAAGAAP
jgi:AcrR family transcriptional regulator